jgi:hypothetical protein
MDKDEVDVDDEDDENERTTTKKKKKNDSDIDNNAVQKKQIHHRAIISSFTFDKRFIYDLVLSSESFYRSNTSFKDYVYHKIVCTLKKSLCDRYCVLTSSSSLWTEIIGDIQKVISNDFHPKLLNRQSKKVSFHQLSDFTDEQQQQEKTNAMKERKKIVDKITRDIRTIVKSNMKIIINIYKKYEKDENKDIINFLSCTDVYDKTGNLDIKFLCPTSSGELDGISNCARIMKFQMIEVMSVYDSVPKTKVKKQLVGDKMPLLKTIDDGSSSSTSQLSLPPPATSTTATTTTNKNMDDKSMDDKRNLFSSPPPSSTNPTIDQQQTKNHTNNNNFENLNDGETYLDNDTNKVENIVNNNASSNLFSISSSTTTSSTINPSYGDGPSFSTSSSSTVNLLNDFNPRSSFKQTKLLSLEEMFYNDLISVIFGFSDYIMGASNKTKLYFDNPKLRIDPNNSPNCLNDLVHLVEILSDRLDSKRKFCDEETNIDDDANVVEDNKILKKALYPLHFSLMLKMEDIFANDMEDNPYSLYGELSSIKGGGSPDNTYSCISNILAKFVNLKKDNENVIIQDSKNLFNCVKLFCERSKEDNNLVEQNFPISLHATPSCFSILPYLLFQQCNEIVPLDDQIKTNAANNDVINEKKKIWGILSNYQLFEKNNYPSIFLPSLHELFQIVESTDESWCFIWLKNGNFKSFQKNRLQESFLKSFDNFVENLEISFAENMKTFIYDNNGYNFMDKHKHYIEVEIKTKVDLLDTVDEEEEADVDCDEKKEKQDEKKNKSSSFCFNLSKAFKKHNPLFCCFDYNCSIQAMRCRNLLQCLFALHATTEISFAKEEFYEMIYNPLHMILFHKIKKDRGVYFRLFTEGEMLNDDCVNFSIHIIFLEELKKRFVLLPLFNEDSLIPKYKSFNQVEDLVNKKSGNIKPKYMFKYKDYFSKDIWIIPMFVNPIHWKLFIVVQPNRIHENKCTILILDSLHHFVEKLGEVESNEVFQLKLYLTECFNYQNSTKRYADVFHGIRVFKLMDAPQQTDGISCGWFCILYAKFAVGIIIHYSLITNLFSNK